MKTTPDCHCGNSDAEWRGDRYGLRQYACRQCAKSDLVMAVGRPTHFQPTNKKLTACGLVGPSAMAYDGRSVDCLRCVKTKSWKRYMGK